MKPAARTKPDIPISRTDPPFTVVSYKTEGSYSKEVSERKTEKRNLQLTKKIKAASTNTNNDVTKSR